MLGDGYGFPSSHSQYMGFFSTFLLLHLTFRHSFVSYGPNMGWLMTLQRTVLYLVVWGWAAGVCYSRSAHEIAKRKLAQLITRQHRYFLTYHTPLQVLAGYLIGVGLAVVHYFSTEPTTPAGSSSTHSPNSKTWRGRLLDSRLAEYWRIRDGWAVYPDGGTEDEYLTWRARWEAQTQKAKAQ